MEEANELLKEKFEEGLLNADLDIDLSQDKGNYSDKLTALLYMVFVSGVNVGQNYVISEMLTLDD